MLLGALIAGALLRQVAGQVAGQVAVHAAAYEASVTGEVRSLRRLQAGATTSPAEADLAPRLVLKLQSRTATLDVTYAPRLWASTATGRTQGLHRAALAGSYQPTWRLKGSATATGAYGVADLLAPAAAQPAGVTPPPGQTVGSQSQLRYVFGEVTSRLDVVPDQRSRLVLKAAFAAEGGGDVVARRTLPLRRGPRASAAYEWRATVFDQLTSEVTGSTTSFQASPLSPGGAPVVMPTVWIGTVTETWRRRTDAEGSTWLGLGAAWVGTGRDAGSMRPVPPVVDAGVQRGSQDGVWKLQLTERYGPAVDAVTGRAYQRADTSLAGSLALSPGLKLTTDDAVGKALGGALKGQLLVSCEVRAVHALTRELDVAWGVRALWQQPPSGTTTPFYRQWTIFLAMAYLHRAAL